MANPYAPYEVMTPDNGAVDLTGEFIVGATGAVPATLTGFREMGTPVRNGVGDYTFPLSQGWQALKEATATIVGAHSATTGKYYEVIADNSTATTSPSVRLQFTRGDTGAVAEIAQNDVLKIRLRLIYKTP